MISSRRRSASSFVKPLTYPIHKNTNLASSKRFLAIRNLGDSGMKVIKISPKVMKMKFGICNGFQYLLKFIK